MSQLYQDQSLPRSSNYTLPVQGSLNSGSQYSRVAPGGPTMDVVQTAPLRDSYPQYSSLAPGDVYNPQQVGAVQGGPLQMDIVQQVPVQAQAPTYVENAYVSQPQAAVYSQAPAYSQAPVYAQAPPQGDISQISQVYTPNQIGAVTDAGVVVAVNKGAPVVKSTRQARGSVVVGQREIGQKIVQEALVGTRVVNQTLNPLPERVFDNKPLPRKSVTRPVDLTEEEAVYVEKVVPKEVEVIVERKVPKKVYVDVPYEVIVEKPIERIIEKEVEYEKVVEKEIEKTVEVPIEKIVEVPIEEVVEQKVEVVEYVDVPVERVVQKTVEQPIDNVIYQDKQIDIDVKDIALYPNAQVLSTNVQHQQVTNTVPRPVFSRNVLNNVVTQSVEQVITRQVDKPVERVVESVSTNLTFANRRLEQPIVNIREEIVEKPVERIVEKPVIVKNVIKKPVPVQKIQENIEEVIEERPVIEQVTVDVPRPQYLPNLITQTIEREVIINKDVDVFTNVGVPVTEVVGKPVAYVSEIPQATESVDNVEIEYLVHKQRPVAAEQVIEVQVPGFNNRVNETVIERPVRVLKVVEQAVPVETEVVVEVENKVEVPVYQEIVEERPVVVNREVIEYYDVIKENVIEVEKVEDVDLATTIKVQRPVESYQRMEERVAVDKNVVVPVQGVNIDEGTVDITDDVLAARIVQNRDQLTALRTQNQQLKQNIATLRGRLASATPDQHNAIQRQLAHHRAERSELQSRIQIMMKDADRLRQTTAQRSAVNVGGTYRTVHPDVRGLKTRLQGLLNENRSLVSQARVL